jgi:hypothetical protein
MIVAVLDMLFPFHALDAVVTALMFNNRKSEKRPVLVIECSCTSFLSPMTAFWVTDTESGNTVTSANIKSLIEENIPFWWLPFIQRTNYPEVDLMLLSATNEQGERLCLHSSEGLTAFLSELESKYQHIVFCTPENNDFIAAAIIYASKVVIHSVSGFTPLPSQIEHQQKTIILTSKYPGSKRKAIPRDKNLLRNYSPGTWDSGKIGKALRKK